MSDAPDTQTHDQELLDQIFERAVEQLEEGLPVVIGDLLGHREDLLGPVERLVRLAQQVVAGQPRTLPAVRGYTILGELGQGGMGTVYLARQERLGGRPVALKVLSPSTALSHSARERFRTEALAIARLQHPNIVAVHDVVHEADVYAYAMEWVDGKSLAELISHLERCGDESGIGAVRTFLDTPAGALEHATAATFICRVGIAIGRALGAVHRAGLLHRDVKPANVLLRRDGTPLLSDFGLARELDTATLTQAGHFVGTPAYAAPEQLRGCSGDLDARTDIYGLGVTLYHALTLRLPFSGGSTADILRRIETGQAVPLRHANPHLSADLQTIVAKAMDLEPGRRYQTAADLADDLERLLSLQPIRARPSGLVTRTVKLARRNRGAVIGATLGGLLALILAVLIGGYAFVVPGWAAAHLSDARLALLEPGRNDAIFATVYWQVAVGKGVACPDDFLHAPLASYQKALRLQPTNAAVRLERDIVELARELGLHPDRLPALPARLRAHARLACTYAERWAEASDRPHLEPQLLENASASELRSLGLLGYLCSDVNTALQAWSQMDLLADPDPLVEASLGQLYLLLDQPARAYPRLRNAFRAFPEAGFLCVSLADAALQCGDFAKAETLLKQARGMERLDPTAGLERVEADLYAATGRDDLAADFYRAITGPHGSSVALYNFGRFLEVGGHPDEALQQYRRAISSALGFGKARRAFVSLCERRWEEWNIEDRRAFLRRALREDFERLVGPYSILRCYAWSLDSLRQNSPSSVVAWQSATASGNSARAAAPSAADAAAAPGSASAAAQVHGRSLADVVRAMKLCGAAPCRARDYPPWLQELQIAVWLSPYAEVGSACIECLDELLRAVGG